MVSLMASKSWASLRSALSDASNKDVPALAPRSPTRSVSSVDSNYDSRSIATSSSSNDSFSPDAADEENATITVGFQAPERRRSQEDLRLLAISSNITELQYTISDIQTRIFEIQELRHQSASAKNNGASDIDSALSSLDNRLASVGDGMKAVAESMEPILSSVQTPTQAHNRSHSESDEHAALTRKHGVLVEEWAGVQREADLLREELREDKWLTVFRTVTDQADGMMNSLDKAVNRCQDFLQHLNSGGPIPPSLWPPDPNRPDGVMPSTIEIFIALTDTFEAKKRHYIPATNKVLSILDKGVQDRVTKNGECLRRHAESTQRWKSLQSRLTRTDAEMDQGRVYLSHGETTPSEAGSSTSGSTAVSQRSGGKYLGTPGATRGASKSNMSLSESISPLRKMARKLKGTIYDPETPTSKQPTQLKTPASEPSQTLRRQRTSIFGFRSPVPFPHTPTTPDKPGHRQTQSIAHTPPSEPHSGPRHSDASVASGSTLRRGKGPMSHAPAWNASTKVIDDETLQRERTATLRPGPTPPRRPSAMGFYHSLSGSSATASTVQTPGGTSPSGTPNKRSLSRSSMTSSSMAGGSSRPWSPLTNDSSTSSYIPAMPSFRAPSRTQRYSQIPAPPVTPRSRPKTPSQIPAPRTAPARISNAKATPDWDRTLMSPIGSYFPDDDEDTPSRVPPPRPPSRSMIPMPSVHISGSSRPGTSMSAYGRPESSMSMASPGRSSNGLSFSGIGRPSLVSAPPSAFRDARTPGGASRPASRTGASRMGGNVFGSPLHHYTPATLPRNVSDPLDMAVATIVNSFPHACMVERVDAPLRATPAAGTEQRATYAFTTPVSRKQLAVKLTPAGKSGERKVLYRAGGGWNELKEYLAAHPA